MFGLGALFISISYIFGLEMWLCGIYVYVSHLCVDYVHRLNASHMYIIYVYVYVHHLFLCLIYVCVLGLLFMCID